MPLFRKPPIHQEVNVHPHRGAVTDVTPQEVKEQARTREFQLLDVLSSLSTGQLASNADLLLAIDRLEQGLGSTHASRYKLSRDGRQLVADIESLLRTARAFIEQKNQNEELQKLFYHASLAAKGSSLPTMTPGYRAQAGEGAQGAAQAAGDLIRLVLTDPNFRGLLADVTDIFRSSYGGALHSRVKSTLLGNQGPGGQGHGRMAADDSGIAYETADEQLRRSHSRRTTHATSMRRSASVAGYGEPIVTRTLPPEHKVYVDNADFAPGPAAATFPRSSVGGGEFFDERTFHQHTRRGTTTSYRSTVASLRDRIPAEHQAKLASRVRALLADLADNPQYQDSINFLIDTVTLLADSIGTGAATSGGRVDANVYATAIELKRVFESLAGASLTPVLEAWYGVLLAVRGDAHLKAWLADMRAFAEKGVRDPRSLDQRDFKDRLAVLLDRGAVWSDTPVARRAIDASLEFLDALRNDKVTRAMARDVGKVTETLAYAPDGRFAFKGDLVNDMRVVFLPALLSTIKYIALPRIEHRDPDYDLVVENVVLTSSNFLPNLFEIEMVNRAQVSPRAEIDDRFTHLLSFNAYQIQADVHDVSFYYRKKTGFPKLRDWGVADLAITGEGIHVHVVVELDRSASVQTLVPLRVRCNVDDIRLTIHHSKYDTAYKLLAPILKGAIRRAIIDNVEKMILGYLLSADALATRFKQSRAAERSRLGITPRSPSFLRSFVPAWARRGTHHDGDEERAGHGGTRRLTRRLGGGDARYRLHRRPESTYGGGGNDTGLDSGIYQGDDDEGGAYPGESMSRRSVHYDAYGSAPMMPEQTVPLSPSRRSSRYVVPDEERFYAPASPARRHSMVGF